jgi:cardiolipin synthase
LKQAVLRKVEVHLMADGYASKEISEDFIAELKAAGIQFRFFEPLFRSRDFYFGRRMHHKITVADTKYALVGGINISNRYNDMPHAPAWLDFALYAEGEIARELCILCWKSWNGYPMNMGVTPCEQKALRFDFSPGERSAVRMRRNDWVRRKNQISSTYVEILRSSKKEVTILCSYFLPSGFIRKQMVDAVKRGVKIRVITAGVSDVKVAKSAERWLYDWLLRNRIELYEYQENILHGKMAVCDSEWMTIGSYNINNISAYASIELNLDVHNPSFVSNTRNVLQQIIEEDCIPISMEEHLRTKNIFKQFGRWLSYEFIRAVFHLFTFYFKHRA